MNLAMLLVLPISILWASAWAAETCKDGRTTLHVSATATRNATGHWHVQAGASSPVAARPRALLRLDAQLAADGACEDDVATLSLSADVAAPPRGYERMPFGPTVTSLYRMHVHALTWPEAAAVCRNEGAHLIIINSDAETLVVNEYFARKPIFVDAVNSFWFAVGHRRHFGRNETVLGESLEDSGFNKWAPDQWGLTPEADCGIMDRRLLFALEDCVHKRAFICEWESRN